MSMCRCEALGVGLPAGWHSVEKAPNVLRGVCVSVCVGMCMFVCRCLEMQTYIWTYIRTFIHCATHDYSCICMLNLWLWVVALPQSTLASLLLLLQFIMTFVGYM